MCLAITFKTFLIIGLVFDKFHKYLHFCNALWLLSFFVAVIFYFRIIIIYFIIVLKIIFIIYLYILTIMAGTSIINYLIKRGKYLYSFRTLKIYKDNKNCAICLERACIFKKKSFLWSHFFALIASSK